MLFNGMFFEYNRLDFTPKLVKDLGFSKLETCSKSTRSLLVLNSIYSYCIINCCFGMLKSGFFQRATNVGHVAQSNKKEPSMDLDVSLNGRFAVLSLIKETKSDLVGNNPAGQNPRRICCTKFN